MEVTRGMSRVGWACPVEAQKKSSKKSESAQARRPGASRLADRALEIERLDKPVAAWRTEMEKTAGEPWPSSAHLARFTFEIQVPGLEAHLRIMDHPGTGFFRAVKTALPSTSGTPVRSIPS